MMNTLFGVDEFVHSYELKLEVRVQQLAQVIDFLSIWGIPLDHI